jgi:hypothetical protein
MLGMLVRRNASIEKVTTLIKRAHGPWAIGLVCDHLHAQPRSSTYIPQKADAGEADDRCDRVRPMWTTTRHGFAIRPSAAAPASASDPRGTGRPGAGGARCGKGGKGWPRSWRRRWKRRGGGRPLPADQSRDRSLRGQQQPATTQSTETPAGPRTRTGVPRGKVITGQVTNTSPVIASGHQTGDEPPAADTLQAKTLSCPTQERSSGVRGVAFTITIPRNQMKQQSMAISVVAVLLGGSARGGSALTLGDSTVAGRSRVARTKRNRSPRGIKGNRATVASVDAQVAPGGCIRDAGGARARASSPGRSAAILRAGQEGRPGHVLSTPKIAVAQWVNPCLARNSENRTDDVGRARPRRAKPGGSFAEEIKVLPIVIAGGSHEHAMVTLRRA